MTPCATRGRPTLVGLLFVGLLVVMACTSAPEEERASGPAPVPDDVVRDVNEVFAVYRSAVAQNDGDAVIASITPGSLASQQAIAELARTADRPTVTAQPAVDQLLILAYRLDPELLDADVPFRALVEAGRAGQDAVLGDLGELTVVDEDRVLGVVVDAATRQPTPLRWQFLRVDGDWRFDLDEANRLTSQTIATAASRTDQTVEALVLGDFVRLSGLDLDAAEALYEPPA